MRVVTILLAIVVATLFTGRRPASLRAPALTEKPHNKPDPAALVQFHAAEYSAARGAVFVWITVQYAIIPIMFGAWFALALIQKQLDHRVFYWACALVLPLCYVAYQKAMIDALTALLIVEQHVRWRAIKLAGTDEFWFHEPIYRRDVPTDAAYAWYWPPIISFASPIAMLLYRTVLLAAPWWWEMPGYLVCCGVAWFVGWLSKRGLKLNRAITAAIQDRELSWLRENAANTT